MGLQQGPSSISAEPGTGGPSQTIYSNPTFGITALQVISNRSLIFYVDNYSNAPGHTVDTSQNGLWKINTDGSGLIHLATLPTTGAESFAGFHPKISISPDGHLYAISIKVYPGDPTSLQFGPLNGGPATTFIASSNGTTVMLAGWTAM
jgi:hypothetical protein